MFFGKKNLLILLAVLFITGLDFAQAQNSPLYLGGIELISSADYPKPGQNLTITAKSYSLDINSSKIVWSVNGKVVDQGTGITKIEITAPELGKKTVVSASAVAPNGAMTANSITISSGMIDLIMESAGYVPPFFKGKIGMSFQNTIKIVAVPHMADSSGNEFDPQTLVYQWKKGSKVYEDQSGYGKQSLVIAGELVPRAFSITVVATTKDGKNQVSGSISVTPASPSIVFYKNDSLYGPLFNNSINKNVQIGSENETSILAVPFGFNRPKSGLGNLGLTWFVNDTEKTELAKNDSVVLRAPDGIAGSSNIELRIQNSKDFLQQARASFTATFKASDESTTTTNI